MVSIFPNKSQGGLVVWEEATGQPVEQPNVENVSIPDGLVATCDITAQPEGCRTPVPQEQVNAIVSELLHLFNAMDPTLPWDCSSLGNLAAAFINFVQSLAGGGGGTPICSAGDGDGSEATAKLVYCNGNTVKLWTIHGEAGLMESIQEQFCSGVNAFPDSGLDTLLYCRQGVVRTTTAQDFSNFQGTWAKAKGYRTNQMVMRNNMLYMPNAPIPPGTDFVVGTTGQTWFEVSSAGIALAYDPTQAYQINTIVSNGGNLYAANANIPANTPFVIGTTGQTWRAINFNNAFILDFTPNTDYLQNQVVTLAGLLYRAKAPLAAGPFQPAQWDLIGGEKNIYLGPWDQTKAYPLGTMVQKNGKLYSPNANIPANTAFQVGVVGTTWYEVSPSFGFAWDATKTYLQDDIVSYSGNFFAANNDLPAGIEPTGAGIGITGQTWRQITFAGQLILPWFSELKDYPARSLVEYYSIQDQSKTGIWRANSTGAPSGPFDFANWQLIGERSSFCGEWSITRFYYDGDLVLNQNASDPHGFYRFNSSSGGQAGVAFAEGIGDGQWTLISANSSWKGQFDLTKSYPAGSYVATPSGIYRATVDQAAGPIVLGTTNWEQTGRHRGIKRIDQDLNAGTDDVGYYLRFESTLTKTLTLSKGVFVEGDVLFGVSVGGQLSFAAGSADVVLNSPDSLNLRNVNGAVFAVTYIGAVVNGGNTTYQFDIAGDLAPA